MNKYVKYKIEEKNIQNQIKIKETEYFNEINEIFYLTIPKALKNFENETKIFNFFDEERIITEETSSFIVQVNILNDENEDFIHNIHYYTLTLNFNKVLETKHIKLKLESINGARPSYFEEIYNNTTEKYINDCISEVFYLMDKHINR